MLLPHTHTAPVSLHSLIHALGELHNAPWRQTVGGLPEGNTKVEGYQQEIFIKQPASISRQERASLCRQITVFYFSSGTRR